jgi:hypothetical protein
MLPATTLLNSNATPFGFRKKTTFRKCSGELLGKDHMTTCSKTKLKSLEFAFEGMYASHELVKNLPILVVLVGILFAVLNAGCSTHYQAIFEK